jgi:hypothetical protein
MIFQLDHQGEFLNQSCLTKNRFFGRSWQEGFCLTKWLQGPLPRRARSSHWRHAGSLATSLRAVIKLCYRDFLNLGMPQTSKTSSNLHPSLAVRTMISLQVRPVEGRPSYDQLMCRTCDRMGPGAGLKRWGKGLAEPDFSFRFPSGFENDGLTMDGMG